MRTGEAQLSLKSTRRFIEFISETEDERSAKYLGSDLRAAVLQLGQEVPFLGWSEGLFLQVVLASRRKF